MVPEIVVEEEAQRMRARRLTFDPCATCPAASAIYETPEGSGVHCAIEEGPIVAGTDPSSLEVYCTADYSSCPTWRWWKESLAAGRVATLREEREPEPEHAGRVELPEQVEVTSFEGPE